ncbi:RiPP maturation radical SAM C-methyltransferase [Nonomuraea lactucae]|uniref:RiPP maturation radical SAM C-methyltransferase n=1 Tax=Nonomuraea lactucae TaxID=2249762 RepID=UPI0013B3C223|nr:RiPP maturation radical SAM C-methyltransferase [Nonomuraea lactucae]
MNMPFAGLHIPSLALTQLKAVLERDLPGEVRVDVHYLNHDVARAIGADVYAALSDDGVTTVTGLTDWLFRRAAFPDLADNAGAYLRRYWHSLGRAGRVGARLDELLSLRELLDGLLDELVERHALDEYDLVGFTAMFDQTAASIAMARRLKSRSPGTVTVIGGAGCELSAGRVLARNVPAFDFVFSGPALRSFPAFVRRLLLDDLDACHEIRGVYSSRNVERLGATLGAEEDLDVRLPLDYDGFLASLRANCPDVRPELLFETSRGCWWGERSHCTFCGLNGTTMKFRSMAGGQALAQFEELFARYPEVSRFFAVDNILDPAYFASVLPFMRAPAGASVFYEMRVLSSAERLKQLAAAGVTRVQPGIEALATSVLTLMGKGTTAFTNIDFLKNARDAGVEVDWNLLIGFPGEDAAVYAKYLRDIPLLLHLPPPGATFPVRFDRYSPYHQHPARFGLELRPADFYELVFPFAEPDRTEFAYFFADHNHRGGYALNLARWRRRVESAVEHWIARWTRRDGGLAPVLRLAGREHVLDSRGGTWVGHEVSPLGAALLEALERPMGVERASGHLGEPEGAIGKEIERLAGQGLLFEEDGKFLNLVTLEAS